MGLACLLTSRYLRNAANAFTVGISSTTSSKAPKSTIVVQVFCQKKHTRKRRLFRCIFFVVGRSGDEILCVVCGERFR